MFVRVGREIRRRTQAHRVAQRWLLVTPLISSGNGHDVYRGLDVVAAVNTMERSNPSSRISVAQWTHQRKCRDVTSYQNHGGRLTRSKCTYEASKLSWTATVLYGSILTRGVRLLSAHLSRCKSKSVRAPGSDRHGHTVIVVGEISSCCNPVCGGELLKHLSPAIHPPRLRSSDAVATMMTSITSLCGCCQWTCVAVGVMESRSELKGCVARLRPAAMCGCVGCGLWRGGRQTLLRPYQSDGCTQIQHMRPMQTYGARTSCSCDVVVRHS
jgi:hypothetical protein